MFRLLANEKMYAGLAFLRSWQRVPFHRCRLLLMVLFYSSEIARCLWLVPAWLLVLVIFQTFVIMPLIPILSMFPASPFESTTFVRRTVVVVMTPSFIILVVAPVFFVP